ncbi:MAG: sulfite exporter TauE/SafE family protein [Arcticibacter sp.]
MEVAFLIILFCIALLYSSVGHGGASGYLALMAIYGFSPEEMKPSALILNVCVALIAAIQFQRSEKINWKLFLPLIIGSIPMAYLGASMSLDADIYKKLLGVVLIFQSFRLFGIFMPLGVQGHQTPHGWIGPVFTGAAIGLLSGLIGIGGGIILSPLLLLFRWCSLKQTALISAGFIFVNSISGLVAIGEPSIKIAPEMSANLAIGIIGGVLGGWLGSRKFNSRALQITLGIVLLFAGSKLIFAF